MCRHLRSWSFRVDSEALRLPHQVEPPEVQMFRQYLQRPGELKIHRDCQAIAEPAPLALQVLVQLVQRRV